MEKAGSGHVFGSELTNRIAAAGQAAAATLLSVVVVQAALTVWAISIIGTVPAMAAMTGGSVQLCVIVTLGALTVTIAG